MSNERRIVNPVPSRTPSVCLLALLFLLCGCATTQKLADEDRKRIGVVRISSNVQVAPAMFYLGPDTGVLFAFGAVGGAAAAATSADSGKALQQFAEKNNIFIEKIALEEIDAAIRQAGKLKVLNTGEPTDAVVNVIVYQYGFGIPHGFSSRVGPILGIRCEIADAAGKVLGSANDYVLKGETMALQEMRDDPKRIEDAWRKAAKRIAASIAAAL